MTTQLMVVALQPEGIVEVLLGVIMKGAQPIVGLTVNWGEGGLKMQIHFMMLSILHEVPVCELFLTISLIQYVPGVVKFRLKF